MKKQITILVIFTLLAKMEVYCQEHLHIISQQTTVQYLQNKPGGSATIIKNIKVMLEFWTDNKSTVANQTVSFAVEKAGAPKSDPVISMVDPVITKDKFKTSKDTIEYTVPIILKAVAPPFLTEAFSIGLSGKSASVGGGASVVIQEDEVEEISKTPPGLTYLNAVNFDFQGSNGASYVGHLNVYKPDLIKIGKNSWIGLNLGVMKVDFSRQDSLNTTFNYNENVKIKPLDSIVVGKQYLRQYNKFTTVSKNVTWSFYFQPMISLMYRKNCKIFLHFHTEFYIDKWNTTTTINNYQQDTAVIAADNINSLRNTMSNINTFQKSIADGVSSTSSSIQVNFNLGVGFTVDVNLWDGGSLFVQPTIGKAFNYERPQAVNRKSLSYRSDTTSFLGHLTRFALKQQITPNMQAVMGVDIRGKFKTTPTYASYIGVNLGLSGIKKLIN